MLLSFLAMSIGQNHKWLLEMPTGQLAYERGLEAIKRVLTECESLEITILANK